MDSFFDAVAKTANDIARKTANAARTQFSNGRCMFEFEGHQLDLCYVTDRIVAMGYPSQGAAALVRNDIRVIRTFLRSRHGDKFMVFNLTTDIYESQNLDGKVEHRFGFPDHHAPTLFGLLELVAAMASFLDQDPANVAVVHCLAGRGRTGTAVCSYLVSHMMYDAETALTVFSAARCVQNTQAVRQPSQIRYVHYVERLRSFEDLRPVAPKVILKRVEISRAPDCGDGSCAPYLQIEKEFVKVYDVFSAPRRVQAENVATFELPDLVLDGDLCLRVFNEKPNLLQDGTTLDSLFRVQFNTLFIAESICATAHPEVAMIEFGLNQLDEANETPLTRIKRFNHACVLRVFYKFC